MALGVVQDRDEHDMNFDEVDVLLILLEFR